VPALILDDGETLTENVAIPDWISHQDGALKPSGAMGCTHLLQALAFISTEIHMSFKPFFIEAGEDEKRKAREPTAVGQENVWDVPRPAVAQPVEAILKVLFAGRTIANTSRAVRTIETSHPPTYYFPLEDIETGVLRGAGGGSFCEWKGSAAYFDVVVGDRVARRAAWTYPDPSPAFRSIRDHVAFYAAEMDACFVDGEHVEPQPGDFYGGWITSKFTGPFKGVPGSQGW
jgi:uncharacterized protein (DUF427 family)